MKKIILNPLMLTLIGITLIACNKEKISPLDKSIFEESTTKEKPKGTDKRYSVTILTKEQLEYTGNYHNESLNLIFKNFDWEADSIEKEFVDNVKSNNIQLKNYSDEYLLSRCVNDYTTNYNALKKKLSAKSFAIIDDAIIFSNDISEISTFKEEINLLQEKARKEITDIVELNTVLVTLEVFIYSAYFWAPQSIGGSGIGEQYLASFNNQRKTMKDVLVADGMSAGIGMLGVAVAGMLGPIGWGALAIVGGEAALSSGAALLT